MDLILSTRNQDKLTELRDVLAEMPFTVRSAADFDQIPEVEETGETLAENALQKARAAFIATHQLSLADDTGLEIDALDGAPGVRSARYAGEKQNYEENLLKVLADMKAVSPGARAARFRTAVAILFPDGSEAVVHGVCEGEILTRRRGEGGFGYDPIFFVPDLGKTFSEMSLADKQAISHRGRAMRRAQEILQLWITKQEMIDP